jgi:hypothetical protein
VLLEGCGIFVRIMLFMLLTVMLPRMFEGSIPFYIRPRYAKDRLVPVAVESLIAGRSYELAPLFKMIRRCAPSSGGDGHDRRRGRIEHCT